MPKDLNALRDKLESCCLSYEKSDVETLKKTCAQIELLDLDQQIEIFSFEVGGYSNILNRNLNLRPLNFHYLFNIVKEFSSEALRPLLLGLDGNTHKQNALMHAANSCDFQSSMCVSLVCELIKKIPLESRVKIFKHRSTNNETVLDIALWNVYYFRNPKGFSNALHCQSDDASEKQSHAYFNAVVGPLLEVMKDFPLEVKEELYNAILNSLWYLNRFPKEKQRIKAAIGVHRPFGPIQKTFFSLGVGAAFTGGAFWLLIVAGVITSHAFVMVAWPAAITATTVGFSAMLAINLYARCQNPIIAYGSQQDEVVPLLEGNEGLSCG